LQHDPSPDDRRDHGVSDAERSAGRAQPLSTFWLLVVMPVQSASSATPKDVTGRRHGRRQMFRLLSTEARERSSSSIGNIERFENYYQLD
jgi:hypothetical protein